MKYKKTTSIKKNKFLYIVLIAFLLFILFCFTYTFYFSRIVIINTPNKIQNSITKLFYEKARNNSFIVIPNSNNFFMNTAKIIFPNINILCVRSQTRLKDIQIISEDEYYLTVDITNDLSQINKQDENKNFEFFKNGIKTNVRFNTINQLSMKKRVLIRESDASIIKFYKTTYYEVKNASIKKMQYIKKKINFNNKQNNTQNVSLLGFAGDLVIEEFVKQSIKSNGYKYSLSDVNNILQTPDIMSVNNEYVISNRGKKEPKHFTFRASEKEASILFDSPIDYVTCANNHAMDYGRISLLDTIFFLNKHHIKHSGTGKNLTEAFSPSLLKNKKNRFAYYSICNVSNETNGYTVMKNFSATNSKAGIAYYDISILKKLFKNNKQNGFLNIVQAHMGKEYSTAPSNYIKKLTHKLIDNGADAVICHHPHTINGVEIYKSKIIAYSLGDFLLDVQKKNADEGIIILLLVNNNKIISWAFYPTVCNYGKVILDNSRITNVKKRFLKYTSLL